MKFYVIEFQTYADGNVGHIITTHDTKEEAESKFHLVLSAAAVSGLPMHSAVIITPDGFVQKKDCYVHEQPEV